MGVLWFASDFYCLRNKINFQMSFLKLYLDNWVRKKKLNKSNCFKICTFWSFLCGFKGDVSDFRGVFFEVEFFLIPVEYFRRQSYQNQPTMKNQMEAFSNHRWTSSLSTLFLDSNYSLHCCCIQLHDSCHRNLISKLQKPNLPLSPLIVSPNSSRHETKRWVRIILREIIKFKTTKLL
jgi:hypothetical protein